MQNNMHELADIIRLAAELDIDRVKGHQLWAHFDEIQDLSFRKDAESIAQWNEYVRQAHDAAEKYRKPDGSKVLLDQITPLAPEATREMPEQSVCPFLNQELWVSATGKISPCCAPDEQRDSLGDFGNIAHTTLAETLQSKGYQELLANYKQHPLCKTCNMRKMA